MYCIANDSIAMEMDEDEDLVYSRLDTRDMVTG